MRRVDRLLDDAANTVVEGVRRVRRPARRRSSRRRRSPADLTEAVATSSRRRPPTATVVPHLRRRRALGPPCRTAARRPSGRTLPGSSTINDLRSSSKGAAASLAPLVPWRRRRPQEELVRRRRPAWVLHQQIDRRRRDRRCRDAAPRARSPRQRSRAAARRRAAVPVPAGRRRAPQPWPLVFFGRVCSFSSFWRTRRAWVVSVARRHKRAAVRNQAAPATAALVLTMRTILASRP